MLRTFARIFLASLHSERNGLGSDIWEIFVEVKIGVVDASLNIHFYLNLMNVVHKNYTSLTAIGS